MVRLRSIGIKSKIIALTTLLLGLLAISWFVISNQAAEKTAPYSGVRWEVSGIPTLLVDGKWYGAQAIDGIAVDDILTFAVDVYGKKARKRFAEDLVEVLHAMGHKPRHHVELQLLDLQTGAVVHMNDVAMTESARASVKDDGVFMSAAAARIDLDDLQRQLEQRFAYLTANAIDYLAAIDTLRNKINGPIVLREFNNEISKVIALFVDGHAGPRFKLKTEPRLPFTIRFAGDRLVAVNLKRTKVLDSDYPYIREIGGRSFDEWLIELRPYIAQGSPQLIKRRGADLLLQIDGVRRLVGQTVQPTVEVVLESTDGMQHKAVVLETTFGFGRSQLPTRLSSILPNNIGYLRLSSFRGRHDIPGMLTEWMPKFRDTNGLIIDVRGNGGGSRAGLVELLPYFLSPEEIRISNVSSYRLYSEFDDDHLSGSRYAYREDYEHWTPLQRKAIHSFAQNFSPEVVLPQGQFSDWHYLVLSRKPNDTRYRYDKPVVVLIDEGCFSATDIFVGAFKGLENVTIMGQATSGGSARSVTEILPHSGIKVKLASMMSFQANGLLYDGRGIEPDIYVVPEPGVFIHEGYDNVIDSASKLLKSSR